MITWNVEGLSRNYHTLEALAKQSAASLIFLSEPPCYRCDLPLLLDHFSGVFGTHLNSEDAHDMDLPLTHPKAKGGTMIMWHPSLSPFLKILPTSSPSFISVLLTPPGILPSVHTAVYLPTAGKDGEWLATLVDLEQHVMLNAEKYGNPATFLRGDFNGSSKNKTRNPTLLTKYDSWI